VRYFRLISAIVSFVSAALQHGQSNPTAEKLRSVVRTPQRLTDLVRGPRADARARMRGVRAARAPSRGKADGGAGDAKVTDLIHKLKTALAPAA
jgi:hypothetical protein